MLLICKQLLALIAGLAAVTLASAAEPHSLSVALDECVQKRDWAKEQCNFINNDATAERFRKFSYAVIPNAISTMSRARCELSKMSKSPLSCSGADEGEQQLALLKIKLREAAAARGLSSCLSACMALCASSHLIKYSRSLDSKFSGPAGVVANGEADCTGYSILAERILRDLGIESRVVSTGGGIPYVAPHAIVKIKIGDGWYFAEPQVARCNFYQ